MENPFEALLSGSDLRVLRNADEVIAQVNDQKSFSMLFSLVFHQERTLVMRAIDAVEKITLRHSDWLLPHKQQLLEALRTAGHKELKWHIAQLITRLPLDDSEVTHVWHILEYWALNPNESKIVRVNSLQGMSELAQTFPRLRKDFLKILNTMSHVAIPSIQARLRRIRKSFKE